VNEQQDRILELLNKEYRKDRLDCWHLYLAGCTRNNIAMPVPFSKFIEIYDKVHLEQLELSIHGFSIEVGDITEQQKKYRMAPNIIVKEHRR